MADMALPSCAVLLVCHNRRELTLRAMRSLAANRSFDTEVVLFDDASTDGTAEAVLAEFPATIIERGDGAAFWNGGLYRAWKRALELPADAFLWLNDDVALDADAFARLAESWRESSASVPGRQFILVGATRGSDGRLTYGGYKRVPNLFALRLDALPIVDKFTQVDTFNGNIVLIPREVVALIGINDPMYFHAFGDIDYGLRATRAGVKVMLLPATMGICEKNLEKGFNESGLGFRERWKRANSHVGLPVRSQWRLVRRHSGIWFLLHFIAPYRSFFGFGQKPAQNRECK